MKIKMLMILVVLLVSFGMTYAADSVSIALYNVTDGAYVTNGSTIQTEFEGTPILYRVEFSLENDSDIAAISFGLRFSSDGALKTNWESQGALGYGPTGYNTGTASIIVEPGTRLADPLATGPFDLGGMIVFESDVDSTAPDAVLIGGAALFHKLDPGPMDNLWSYYLTLGNETGADISFDVDSAKIGGAGDWIVTTVGSTTMKPGFNGGIHVTVAAPSAADDDNPAIAYVYNLKQNFPNPFNPTTQIDYSLARKSKVSIAVFNILGQQVNTLVDGEVEAGPHTVYWNGDDSRGDAVASGIYFYKMVSDEFVKTHKMVLMR